MFAWLTAQRHCLQKVFKLANGSSNPKHDNRMHSFSSRSLSGPSNKTPGQFLNAFADKLNRFPSNYSRLPHISHWNAYVHFLVIHVFLFLVSLLNFIPKPNIFLLASFHASPNPSALWNQRINYSQLEVHLSYQSIEDLNYLYTFSTSNHTIVSNKIIYHYHIKCHYQKKWKESGVPLFWRNNSDSKCDGKSWALNVLCEHWKWR